MKIFVDFDEVLFNSGKFVKDKDKIFIDNGISKKIVNRVSDLFSSTSKCKRIPYTLERQVLFLKNRVKADYSKIGEEVQLLMDDLRMYIFSDAVSFFKKIPRKNLFILSYGDVNYQKSKIYGSRISKYFYKIIVNTEDKIDHINKIAKKLHFSDKEKILIIDDRPENLKKIEKFKKEIITIRMRRPGGRYSHLDCNEADYEVKNFKEALEIINRLKD